MTDINRVILVGRLTRDSETKFTQNGQAVCKFSIAVNRKKKVEDRWEDEGHFFDVVLWGRQAEAINQYLVKGKQVAIDGELRQDRWEQDGQKRSRVEIVANNLQLLGGGTGASGGGGGSYGGGGGYSGSGSGGGGYSGGGSAGGGYPGGGYSGGGASNYGGGGGFSRSSSPPPDEGSSGDNFSDDIPF